MGCQVGGVKKSELRSYAEECRNAALSVPCAFLQEENGLASMSLSALHI